MKRKSTTHNIIHLLILLSVVAFMSCKHKKADLEGDAPVKVNDFMAAFAPLTLPYSVADSNINAVADTVSIGHNVLKQFIPDSVIEQLIDAKKPFKIHPVGRFEKEKEIWREQLANEKKPAEMIEKIMIGKEKKFREESALLTQPFVKNPEMTVGDLVTEKIGKIGENIQIGEISRLEL